MLPDIVGYFSYGYVHLNALIHDKEISSVQDNNAGWLLKGRLCSRFQLADNRKAK
jgi:hypothetical protein